MTGSSSTDDRTIADFGRQWQTYTSNSGWYGSLEMLADICGPLMSVDEFNGLRVAEIGAGSGRITCMMLDAGASHVTAIEPSDAYTTLVANTSRYGGTVKLVRGTGEEVGSEDGLDLVVSIGVLHHIVDPRPVVSAAHRALRPGGKLLIWLYGIEGNEMYVRLCKGARAVTKHMPHSFLAAACHLIVVFADLYAVLCRFLPLPMRRYLVEVFAKLERDKRRLVIYDQLNPAYARYYSRGEAHALLDDAGFQNIRLHHRHGYSWTVEGEKAATD